MIEADTVTFDYPGVRALDSVTFRIEQATVTALVGPNGAGKSTLLRCLAGLAEPLDGRVRVAGVDVIAEPRRAHRHLGYLADDYGLYEALTVERSLAYVAAANGVPEARIGSCIDWITGRLDLARRRGAVVGTLSRGLRQRVAIGMALVHRPPVALLDEPASHLDPDARLALAALFRELRADGATVVVSSHILAELDQYCDAVLILREGRLVEHRPIGSEGVSGAYFDAARSEAP